MSESRPLQKQLTVINKLGLHARAAAKLVTLASGFQASISLEKGQRKVNGKSIMGVLMLAAAQGSQVLAHADGEDAEAALKALEALFADRFGEDA